MAFEVTYPDTSKAFDGAPYRRLLSKVSYIEIIDPLVSWQLSYLTQISQVVSINLLTSNPGSGGAIQGSILCPLLFLLYTNEALNSMSQGVPFLYADDIEIISSLKPNEVSIAFEEICASLTALDH